MFTPLAGSKLQSGPQHARTRAAQEARLRALELAEQAQRDRLKRRVEQRVALDHDRPSVRAPLHKPVSERNAYVQLFKSAEGDAEAAAALVAKFDSQKASIDLVPMIPECARAIAKYEKVLAVMEAEDEEFDELYKKPVILAQKFKRANPEVMQPRFAGVSTSAARLRYGGVEAGYPVKRSTSSSAAAAGARAASSSSSPAAAAAAAAAKQRR